MHVSMLHCFFQKYCLGASKNICVELIFFMITELWEGKGGAREESRCSEEARGERGRLFENRKKQVGDREARVEDAGGGPGNRDDYIRDNISSRGWALSSAPWPTNRVCLSTLNLILSIFYCACKWNIRFHMLVIFCKQTIKFWGWWKLRENVVVVFG